MRAAPGAGRRAPAGGHSLFFWFYIRLSAIAMVGLVIGHLYIMHVLNSTDTLDFAFVAERLRGPFWRVYDLLILLFALSHGLIGLRGILDDYIHHRGWRVAAEVALWSVGLVFLTLGAFVLLAVHVPTEVRP